MVNRNLRVMHSWPFRLYMIRTVLQSNEDTSWYFSYMHLKNRIILMTMKYTKIITNSILLKFNCIAQFDRCCKDWDKGCNCHFSYMHLKNRIILMMTKYNKINTISILLKFNCVAQFDRCCKDWDKVTVTFVTCSSNILIYVLQKWEQLSLGYSVSLKNKGFRPQGLRFRLVSLHLRPQGLGSSVFIFHTSLTAPQSQE